MIYAPDKYLVKHPDVIEELLTREGELTDKEAQILLVRTLRSNLFLTCDLLLNFKLVPYQEINLKALLMRNYSMLVWGRGAAKSTIAAIFCILECIFNPNTNIIVTAPTFRTARQIFDSIEKFAENKQNAILRQCVNKIAHRTDMFYCDFHNGSTIKAIPLNGDKIRGFRANVLVLDEYLTFNEEVVKTVLMPFLVAPKNIRERLMVREMEDKYIKEGVMREEDRRVFEDTTKMVCLSSASYTFEYLYKQFVNWSNNIYLSAGEERAKYIKEGTFNNVTSKYFISQISYELVPDDLKDPNVIAEAKDGGADQPHFLREYCAQFVDGSDSYYSARKLEECTLPDGETPTLEIVGDAKGMYIFGLDPNLSSGEKSDHFGMSVLKINGENRQPTLVHSYASTGETAKHHAYFLYLYKYFHPTMIIIDSMGAQFIESANESMLFKQENIKLTFFEFDSSLEGYDYTEECRKVRNIYNKQEGVICVKRQFSPLFIRQANEYLKGCVDYKKLKFGSAINPNSEALTYYQKKFDAGHINLALTPFFDKLAAERDGLNYRGEFQDAVDFQDRWIKETKKQMTLLVTKISEHGSLSFDLPPNLKHSKDKNRARKDSYTALLLANWMNKGYWDIMTTDFKRQVEAPAPIIGSKRYSWG